MILTAQQVFTHARDLHPALSEVNAPIPLGLRQLSRSQRDLIAAIAVRVPAYVAQVATVPLPLADFDAGIDLNTVIPGDWTDLLQGSFAWADVQPEVRQPRKAEFVPYEQRSTPRRLPAFTYLNDVIFLLGRESDYSQFSAFQMSYSPIPADVTDVTSELLLATEAREALAWDVAAFWMMRLVGMPQLQVTGDIASAYNARAAEERKAYLSTVFRLTQRAKYVVNVVY